MAERYRKRTTLHVEGKDDLFAITELLSAHGFQQDAKTKRDVEINDAAKEKEGFGRAKLLEDIPRAVKAVSDGAVAFVVDADESVHNTWVSVRDRMRQVEHVAPFVPDDLESGGVVFDISKINARVGVWIMPDNERTGMIEDFIKSLVKTGDAILPIAEDATDRATAAGASITTFTRPKAVIHAWLAWQEKPGRPFGTAIGAGYFDHEAESAKNFVKWLRRLIA